MLAVLEVTLVSKAVMLEVFEVTLVSSAVMLIVFELTLVSNAVMLAVLDVILFDNETVSLPILKLSIAEVSEMFNFVFILFDKVIVSLKL